MLSRARLGWTVLFLGSAAIGVACSINPQPLPPGETGDNFGFEDAGNATASPPETEADGSTSNGGSLSQTDAATAGDDTNGSNGDGSVPEDGSTDGASDASHDAGTSDGGDGGDAALFDGSADASDASDAAHDH